MANKKVTKATLTSQTNAQPTQPVQAVQPTQPANPDMERVKAKIAESSQAELASRGYQRNATGRIEPIPGANPQSAQVAPQPQPTVQAPAAAAKPGAARQLLTSVGGEVSTLLGKDSTMRSRVGAGASLLARGAGVYEAAQGILNSDAPASNRVDNTFMGAATAIHPVVGTIGNIARGARDALIEAGLTAAGKLSQHSNFTPEQLNQYANAGYYDKSTGRFYKNSSDTRPVVLADGNVAMTAPEEAYKLNPNLVKVGGQTGQQAAAPAVPVAQQPTAAQVQAVAPQDTSQNVSASGRGVISPKPAALSNAEISAALANGTMTEAQAESILSARMKSLPTIKDYLSGKHVPIRTGGFYYSEGMDKPTVFGEPSIQGNPVYGSWLENMRKSGKINDAELRKSSATGRIAAGEGNAGDFATLAGAGVPMPELAQMASTGNAAVDAAVGRKTSKTKGRVADLYNEFLSLDDKSDPGGARRNAIQNKMSAFNTLTGNGQRGAKNELREVGGGFDENGNPIPKRLVVANPDNLTAREVEIQNGARSTGGTGNNDAQAIAQAKLAIQQGRDPSAVVQRLAEHGIKVDPRDLM